MFRLFSLLFLLSLAVVAIAQEPAEKKAEAPSEEDTSSLEFNGLFTTKETEKQNVAALYAALEHPQAAQAVMAEVAQQTSELELRALRNLDRELAKSKQPEHVALVAQAVRIMALSGEATTLQYLHKVFDSRPTRRATIAAVVAEMALAGKRRPHDWPLLVRSLTVVDADQAVLVLQALLRHREHATSPAVVRNVILLGARLQPAQAEHAWKVLEYWTGEKLPANAAAWQAWFTEKHPYLPPATLPREGAASPHKFAQILQQLDSLPSANIQNGAKLFETAQCIKCHYAVNRGEKIGPDLTKVVQRLSPAEIVESVLFPSQQIFDQYVTKRVILSNGKFYSGLVSDKGDHYDIFQSTGEKISVAKTEVEELIDSPLSTMPTGLWDKLSLQEIADLLAYLQSLPTE